LTHFDAGKPDAADPIERQSSRPEPRRARLSGHHDGREDAPWSRENLLGKNPPPELVELLSNELHVTPGDSALLFISQFPDDVVSVENTLDFAAALGRAGVPFDLHIYAKGGHGIGLGAAEYEPAKFHPWVRECERWLKEQGFAK